MGPRHRPAGRHARDRGHSAALATRICLTAVLLVTTARAATAISFSDVTAAAGLATTNGYFQELTFGEPRVIGGGVAAGDYDRDGWVDLFVVRGQNGAGQLFRNRGNGTFTDVAFAAGVTIGPGLHASATFADADGDGWLDLLVVGFGGVQPLLLRNLGDGTFVDATFASGILLPGLHSFSASFGDYDRDGDLDLFVSRWSSDFAAPGLGGHLWRNDGAGAFTDVSAAAGLPAFSSPLAIFPATLDLSFTGNFTDIDSDGWPDLLVTVDFGGTRVLHNQGDGTFDDVTDPAIITDENGMGAAIGDYDNDGDLDWFVSSIWDPNGIVEGNWGITGNRLYRNAGDGTFSDATDVAGVRIGYWGWGSSFADLDNDADLDLVHVNGWGPLNIPESAEYHADPAVCFVGNGDGTFTESAAALGLADTGQGRGVVAFDYDRDGDVDLFFSNNNGAPKLFRNDGGNAQTHLGVKLVGSAPNSEAIGARVRATTGATTQLRELRSGSNFESQDPAEAHFGLGAATVVDELRITWPDGSETALDDVAARRSLVLTQPRAGAPSCTTSAPGNECIPGGTSNSKTDCLIELRVSPTPPRDPRGVPSRTARCRDGDPACDADGENGSCTFAVALCINNHDPRLAACSPRDVQRLEVTSPRKTSRKALERAVHAQLAVAFGAGGELGIDATSPFANATPDHCTGEVAIVLPLAQSSSGSLRANKVKLGLKARASDKRADADVVVLQCLPAS